MKNTIELTQVYEDRGNYRFYFKCMNKRLYCTQPNYLGELDMYSCSPDGEPSHIITNFKINRNQHEHQ